MPRVLIVARTTFFRRATSLARTSPEAPSVEHLVVVGEQPADANGGVPITRLRRPAREYPSTVDTIDARAPPACVDPLHRRHDRPAQGRRAATQPQHQSCDQHRRGAGYTEDDVLLSVFPLFHANAKYMTPGRGDGLRRQRRSSTGASPPAASGTSRLSERVTAFNGMGEMLRISSSSRTSPTTPRTPSAWSSARRRRANSSRSSRLATASSSSTSTASPRPARSRSTGSTRRRAGLDGRAGPVVRGPHPRRERHAGPRGRAR